MKRIPLILSLALLLLLPVIALYPMLHASAEKNGVDSSTAIQEAAPSEAAPSEAALSEAALSDSAAAAPAAPVAVSGSIDTDDLPLTDGKQQALHRYMTAYYTTLGDLTEASTDGVFCADDIAAYEQAVGNDPSQSRPGMILCIPGWKKARSSPAGNKTLRPDSFVV